MKKTMLKTLSVLGLLALMLSVVVSCSKQSEFTIKGELEGLGAQNIHFSYIMDDQTVEDKSQPAKNSAFEIQGVVDGDAVVEIYDSHFELITRVYVAQGGGKIQVTGNVKDPFNVKVSGNDVAERWSKWTAEHSNMLRSGNAKAIEQAVESYVTQNQKDVLSGLLLTYQYANHDNLERVTKRLEGLGDDAKSDAVMRRLGAMSDPTFSDAKRLRSQRVQNFLMYSIADSIEQFNVSASKASLIYFWTANNVNYSQDLEHLKSLKERKGGRVQIADVALLDDSLIWKRHLKDSPAPWPGRFWGLGGVLNYYVKNMGVTSTPCALVVDSLGRQCYHGSSMDDAIKEIDKIVK